MKSQDNIDARKRVLSQPKYSPVSKSKAVIKFIADRGLSIAALVTSAIAITVVFIDRQHRAEMHSLSVAQWQDSIQQANTRWQAARSESDARWQTTLSESDARWLASQHELNVQWQETVRRSDAQWSQSYRELDRENRLMQQRYDDMKVEFLRVGLNPHPHMPGESK